MHCMLIWYGGYQERFESLISYCQSSKKVVFRYFCFDIKLKLYFKKMISVKIFFGFWLIRKINKYFLYFYSIIVKYKYKILFTT
jgi:hypothetical protein